MTDRTKDLQEIELNKIKLHQKVIANLCSEIGIPCLKSGKITIRNERNWRINEKEIDYSWLINISRSFIGWCWLFSIKFNESNYKETLNSEQLIQGLFTIDKEGKISKFHMVCKTENIEDKIRGLTLYDMFDSNQGMELDGIGYEYLIFAPNTEVRISLNNPKSKNWKIWENEVWTIGSKLAKESGISELKQIFK